MIRTVSQRAVRIVLAAVAALVLAAATADAAERITFGDVTCAPGWPPPHPGHDTFDVVNRSHRTATVYLYRANRDRIVATIKSLRPAASRRVTARLTPGQYAWACDLAGSRVHYSKDDKVAADRPVGGSGPTVVPVFPGELVAPLRAYRRYVAGKITALSGQVASLQAALGSGPGALAAAEAAWLKAHETWLLIGQDDGAYGVFGDLGRRIDGTAAGLVGGVSSARFTGFHRIEYDLWTRGDLTAAQADTRTLGALVTRLQHTRLASVLATTKLSETNWTLRCHEVLEDALRDSLTGDDDYGSHTDLDSVLADVSATRELLGLLAPLITPRSPHLVSAARRELRYLDAVIAGSGDQRVAIAALSRSVRERIDAAVGAVLETLAPVPDLLRIGNT